MQWCTVATSVSCYSTPLHCSLYLWPGLLTLYNIVLSEVLLLSWLLYKSEQSSVTNLKSVSNALQQVSGVVILPCIYSCWKKFSNLCWYQLNKRTVKIFYMTECGWNHSICFLSWWRVVARCATEAFSTIYTLWLWSYLVDEPQWSEHWQLKPRGLGYNSQWRLALTFLFSFKSSSLTCIDHAKFNDHCTL